MLIPYTDYSSVTFINNSCDTIVSLFEQNFFCKEEMKNGCFVLQEGSCIPFVLPKQMLWYISTEINLEEILKSFIKMPKSYNRVIVHDWRTETYLIIEFESDRNETNIVLTYTNYPLRVGFGKWKTEAGRFLALLKNESILSFSATLHDVRNHFHYI